MEQIKLEDIDLSDVDINDDLLAPPIEKTNKPSDIEVTQKIEVVDEDE